MMGTIQLTVDPRRDMGLYWSESLDIPELGWTDGGAISQHPVTVAAATAGNWNDRQDAARSSLISCAIRHCRQGLQLRASTTSSPHLAIAFEQERTPKTPKTRIRGLLASYQRGRGRPSIFRAHISRGFQIASDDPKALLVFSGGYTSPVSATSEGESYLRFARATGLLSPADRFTRVTTEDTALGSFQNVLFSVARFHELTGVYPARITVVGHDFKRRRFEQLHRRALCWPKHHFTYAGIPLGTEADERLAASGELANAFTSYSTDLYGCHVTLVQKCAGQNFHAKAHGYHVGEGMEVLSYGRPFSKKARHERTPISSEQAGYIHLATLHVVN
ncbi:hypothetical protein EDB87DRAFT_1821169 [Lactarius vividus]|nr:hypothetical protein EDB87DRAFT_1821169 [Lactarius vividus]